MNTEHDKLLSALNDFSFENRELDIHDSPDDWDDWYDCSDIYTSRTKDHLIIDFKARLFLFKRKYRAKVGRDTIEIKNSKGDRVYKYKLKLHCVVHEADEYVWMWEAVK